MFLPILDVFPRSPAPMLESPRDGPIESCVPGAGWSLLLRNSRGFHRAPPPPPAKGAENSFSDRSAGRTAAAEYLISRRHGSPFTTHHSRVVEPRQSVSAPRIVPLPDKHDKQINYASNTSGFPDGHRHAEHILLSRASGRRRRKPMISSRRPCITRLLNFVPSHAETEQEMCPPINSVYQSRIVQPGPTAGAVMKYNI